MYYYRLFVYALVLLSLITVLISLSQGFYRYACSDKLLSGDNNEVEFRLSLEFAVAFENVWVCAGKGFFFNNFRKELCTYDKEDVPIAAQLGNLRYFLYDNLTIE